MGMLGTLLKAERIRNNLTQKDVSDAMGYRVSNFPCSVDEIRPG